MNEPLKEFEKAFSKGKCTCGGSLKLVWIKGNPAIDDEYQRFECTTCGESFILNTNKVKDIRKEYGNA